MPRLAAFTMRRKGFARWRASLRPDRVMTLKAGRDTLGDFDKEIST
jgi:hypothetical protein